MKKKIDFVKLHDNINVDYKINNITKLIENLTKNIDINEYFLSFEFTLFVINLMENDMYHKKYKNVNKVNIIIDIIEKIFKIKLNNEHFNERQKSKILSDIEYIYKNKIYKVVSCLYVYFVFFFFT